MLRPKKWKKLYIELLVKGRQLYKEYRNRFKDVEVELYDLNKKLYPYFKGFSVLLMVLALCSFVLSFGFELTDYKARLSNYLSIGVIVGFILLFLSRLVFTSQRVDLIKKRILEALLFVLLLIFGGSYLVGLKGLLLYFESLLGLEHTFGALVNITEAYLILIVVIRTLRAAPILISIRKHPAKVIVTAFMSVIMMGALLLMLPRATVDGQGLSFVNALFTSTSAVCVTGLIVVDTATHLSTVGQMIVLILIQLGGIGIITFATLFALFVGSSLGMGQMMFLKDVVSEDRATDTFATIKRIVALTFTVEAIGVVGYYISWTSMFPDAGNRLYHSVFHAVSAFCNAGFSTFTNSLADQGNVLNLGVNITTMLLIVIGGLGFTTIWELLIGNPKRKIRNRKLSVHAKLVLGVSGTLIVLGAVAFLTLEWSNTLKGYSGSEKMLIGLFQSITTRTAGFNTIDIGALDVSTTIIFLTLMAIGASPASTGGGMKTTTVAVLWLAVVSTARGHDRVEFSKKTIPTSTIFTALTAFTLAAVSLFVFTMLLTITEDLPFLDLLFEEFSAFATVGLSRGITSELSSMGKIIVTVSMFIGRVGSVTLALAFARRMDKRQYKYPKESVIVA